MKEIVNRLHENRQIELAKSILEANGYEVTLKEEIYSSLHKDVMRVVNELSPSAMPWRQGHKIKNTKTGLTAEFVGYKKLPISGKYVAILTSAEEVTKYSLEDLQSDIEAGILVNQSLRK